MAWGRRLSQRCLGRVTRVYVSLHRDTTVWQGGLDLLRGQRLKEMADVVSHVKAVGDSANTQPWHPFRTGTPFGGRTSRNS